MTSKDLEGEKPKKKSPGFRKNISAYFSEYSDYTSIHGVRYIGEKKRSYFERIVWFIILTISLYFCTYLIIKTYEKWVNSPVIVSFARTSTPVWKIPFPAVTICPETKSKQRVYNYTEAYHKYHGNRSNMTDEEISQFEQASLVCDKNLNKEGNKTVNADTIDFLIEIAPQFNDVLWQCKWVNLNQTCDTLFKKVLTEEGICFTFNMLDDAEIFTEKVVSNVNFNGTRVAALHWSLEEGYEEHIGSKTYPHRAISAGHQTCLSMLMTLYEQDLDYICKGPVQGFKILLHNPAEMPQVSQQYFRASLNQETVVMVKPEMMTTADGLKTYDAESRYCFFPVERHLKFFRAYTQRNCEIECLANFTLKRCGCVAFHMPHDNATKICGSGSSLCMKEANTEMVAREVNLGIQNFGIKSEVEMETNPRCNCMPACTSLTYNAESSQADFNWPKVFEAFKVNFSEFPGVAMTRVTFFFREQQFITSERNELYGITDFMANCGGLLGLFIGFSVLSFIEILYFLTLRLWCNFQLHGFKFWSGSAILIKNAEYE